MTITIPISPEVETKLRERAAAQGKDLVQYAAEFFARGITAPTIEEILSDSQADAARSGLSDDEMMELGRKELAALRAEKRQKRS